MRTTYFGSIVTAAVIVAAPLTVPAAGWTNLTGRSSGAGHTVPTLDRVVSGHPLSTAIQAASTQGQDVRVPRSAQDHVELAALYEKVAVQSRAEADSLRRSLQTELWRVAPYSNKTGIEFPWVTKIKQETQRKIAAAEQSAIDAERGAEYHRLRGKEVEGREFGNLTAGLRRDQR